MTSLAELLLEKHLDQAQQDTEASRWTLERADTLAVDVTLSPRRAPDEVYLARLRWDEYPGRLPASVVFLDPETRAAGAKSSWPTIAGVRPPNDICACWTAEGYVAHQEWLHDPNMAWDTGENALLTQLRFLQHEMDFTYQGRAND
jgi:hypothetical protein